MTSILFLQIMALYCFTRALFIQGFKRPVDKEKIKESIPYTIGGWVLLITSFVLRYL